LGLLKVIKVGLGLLKVIIMGVITPMLIIRRWLKGSKAISGIEGELKIEEEETEREREREREREADGHREG